MSRCKESGFALIESMVSLAIFSIAFAGILGIAITNMRYDTKTRNRASVTNLAERITEQWNTTGTLAGSYGFTTTPTIGTAAFSGGYVDPASRLKVDIDAYEIPLLGPRPDWNGTSQLTILSSEMILSGGPNGTPGVRSVKVSWKEHGVINHVVRECVEKAL